MPRTRLFPGQKLLAIDQREYSKRSWSVQFVREVVCVCVQVAGPFLCVQEPKKKNITHKISPRELIAANRTMAPMVIILYYARQARVQPRMWLRGGGELALVGGPCRMTGGNGRSQEQLGGKAKSLGPAISGAASFRLI